MQEKTQVKDGNGVVNSRLNAKKHTFNVKKALNMPKEIKEKDLFGMGYPYHICYYGEKVLAVSSDYGVLVMNIKYFVYIKVMVVDPLKLLKLLKY